MNTATPALITAMAAMSPGMLPSNSSQPMANPAPVTMNPEFITLLAAITRARRSFGVRVWMFACSGTT